MNHDHGQMSSSDCQGHINKEGFNELKGFCYDKSKHSFRKMCWLVDCVRLSTRRMDNVKSIDGLQSDDVDVLIIYTF